MSCNVAKRIDLCKMIIHLERRIKLLIRSLWVSL